MARKLRVYFSGALYHVICRGNQSQRIFSDDGDPQRDLNLPLDHLEFLRKRALAEPNAEPGDEPSNDRSSAGDSLPPEKEAAY